MKHIADAFKNGRALITYICAGDPTPEATPVLVDALIRGGADLIELGLPFSDPVADGPTIQAATQRALRAGMNPDVFFELAKTLPQRVPYAVMTYYNLIFHRGVDVFARDCLESGISGIIVPDLPPEEAGELRRACKKYHIDLIQFVAPTTTEDRVQRVVKNASGFIYLIARLGVTGAKKELSATAKTVIQRVHSSTPKAVGFGISTPEQTRELIKAGADGIIVGSAIVGIIEQNTGDLEQAAAEVEAFTRKLKQAILQ